VRYPRPTTHHYQKYLPLKFALRAVKSRRKTSGLHSNNNVTNPQMIGVLQSPAMTFLSASARPQRASTLLLFLAALVSSTEATGRCEVPYRTISSDCHGIKYDSKTVCLVNDQSADKSCDVLAYRVDYADSDTIARLLIKFPDDDTPAVGLKERRYSRPRRVSPLFRHQG
jgi:hypothetical protein